MKIQDEPKHQSGKTKWGDNSSAGMSKTNRKWIVVAAARPNFMKIAPLMRAIHSHNNSKGADSVSYSESMIRRQSQKNRSSHIEMSSRAGIRPILVHTGQHYDNNMSDAFFSDLNIPAPDIQLGIGSGTHAEQTGQTMIMMEKILLSEKPDLVIVVGDVNSTMAGALSAAKLNIPVAHIEAGLRSYDRTMPEEINRIVTDAVAEYLFTPSPDCDENLLREGMSKEKIFLVGDIMIDSLVFNLEKAKKTDILKRMGLITASEDLNGIKPYALLTLHRPANVDDPATFGRILDGMRRVAKEIPIIFPVHPRTRKQIEIFGMQKYFRMNGNRATISSPEKRAHNDKNGRYDIVGVEPLGYLEFLNLMANAKLVMTDSGGIQEETTALNIPCLTLRDTTERPITLSMGTNVLVGSDPEKIEREAARALTGRNSCGRCPSFWDGRTAERIMRILLSKLN